MKGTKQGFSNNKKNSSKDSFIEAFRDLGSSVGSTVKEDLLKKGAQDIFGAFSPFNRSATPNNEQGKSNDILQRETELERRFRNQFRQSEHIRKQEQVLFTSEQRETQKQVNALQDEIKKLAKATGDLTNEAKEAEISAMQEAPITGKYHVNFFIRLRTLIARLRSEIQESSFWLAAWNKKSKKRNYYWGQFKKSGSKFLLSSDRSSATQAG